MTQTGSVPKNSDSRRRSQAPGWLKAVLPSCWLATFDGVSRRTDPTQTLHTDRSKGTWRIHRDGLTVIALGRGGRGGSASLKVPDARASAGGALPPPGQANITDDTFGMGTSCHSARGAPTTREARERPVLTSWNTHLNDRKQNTDKRPVLPVSHERGCAGTEPGEGHSWPAPRGSTVPMSCTCPLHGRTQSCPNRLCRLVG